MPLQSIQLTRIGNFHVSMELHIAKKGFGVWAVGPARKAKRNCVVYSQEKKKGKKKRGGGLMRKGITTL